MATVAVVAEEGRAVACSCVVEQAATAACRIWPMRGPIGPAMMAGRSCDRRLGRGEAARWLAADGEAAPHCKLPGLPMASFGLFRLLLLIIFIINTAKAADIFLDWDVSIDTTINPLSIQQPIITINGVFPGPLVNATTNDVVHVNVFNNLDEPFLITWNGIQQRLNSWQDGVSGTNCPIKPGQNWTYVFQTKDQIGSFFYFPSINFHKAAGGFGPIRVNNRNVINIPFPKPEAEFDLLIGDWFYTDYKTGRGRLQNKMTPFGDIPDAVLMNGKGPYGLATSKAYESFTVTKGKTYRFRITNVGNALSFNLRIQNHPMVLVETEGSYTNQIVLDSLDVHVGQSYSVLVTAGQDEADYYIMASPKLLDAPDNSSLVAKGLLHYANSVTPPSGPLPNGPDPFDIEFSVNQAKSIRWNLTTGAARPNPQGTFNVTNVTLSQTFVLHASAAEIDGSSRYVVNNVSYLTPDTPLKLADHFANGSGVYQLDQLPIHSVKDVAAYGISVVSGVHKGWLEIVFKNELEVMDSWHLDGFGFYVVGFGDGEWTPESRSSYNLFDPVVRSTVQVYPGRWTAVYAFLDNPGMWNLRSQHLKHWYMGQELYIRVFDNDPNPAKERPPPPNLLLCGIFDDSFAPTPAPAPQVGF
ncbi:monocopper oxidase-like protein SKU5 [Diospyros lotus]|uniref:monocopper oxidase-like protein SKU5 n=1 Tax=Diospyros lotus TaxID=55363 RepID=UPI00224C8D1A|nr:monocopper oxidase-like protein SKU5 [Diospyros lotus]